MYLCTHYTILAGVEFSVTYTMKVSHIHDDTIFTCDKYVHMYISYNTNQQ